MKTFTIDLHHVVLYGLIAVVSLGAFSVLHTWRMDVEKAKAKTVVDELAIKNIEQSQAERAKQYEAQLALLQNLRVTPKTSASVIITRLQGLEPTMNVLSDQLIAPKPDAPKDRLVLDPEQQVTLVNRLIDCHECDKERDKLKGDVADEKTKRTAVEDERDEWKKVAKGGSLWQRVKRRGWHFLEDAIVIEALRCAGGHC